jgi:hypothetical protein
MLLAQVDFHSGDLAAEQNALRIWLSYFREARNQWIKNERLTIPYAMWTKP